MMPKSSNRRPLAWHRECLENMTVHLRDGEAALELHMRNVEFLRSRVEFYRLQINTAYKEEMDAFDAERYLVPRKPKAV